MSKPDTDKNDAPQHMTIPLSAVAEEMALEAEHHRNRKLTRANQVDELRTRVAELEAMVTRLTDNLEAVIKKGAADGAAT